MRRDMSKYPDWSGQWKTARNPLQAFFGFQWDPTKGPGPAQTGAANAGVSGPLRKPILRINSPAEQGEERHSYCVPLGMPRVMTVVYPMGSRHYA